MTIKIKKPTPKLLYMLFFAAVSSLFTSILYALLLLATIPSQLTENLLFIGDGLAMLLPLIVIPFVVILAVYSFARKITNPYLFFTLVFLLFSFLSHYTIFFEPLSLKFQYFGINLLLLTITLNLYTSAVLTYFWKKIFILREKANYLIVPLLLVFGIAGIEYVTLILHQPDPLLSIYISIGEYLKNFGINIFYLDFSGFVGVLLNLIASTSALITAKLNAKVKRAK